MELAIGRAGHAAACNNDQDRQRAEAALLEACRSQEVQIAIEHRKLDEQRERDQHDREFAEQEWQEVERLRGELASWEKVFVRQGCLAEAAELALWGRETVLLSWLRNTTGCNIHKLHCKAQEEECYALEANWWSNRSRASCCANP